MKKAMNSREFSDGFAPMGQALEMFANYKEIRRASIRYISLTEQSDTRRARARECAPVSIGWEPFKIR